jgi:hypothetical protein
VASTSTTLLRWRRLARASTGDDDDDADNNDADNDGGEPYGGDVDVPAGASVTREMVTMRREAVHADVVMYEMMLMLQSQRQRHSHDSCMLVVAIDAIVTHRRRYSLDIISTA